MFTVHVKHNSLTLDGSCATKTYSVTFKVYIRLFENKIKIINVHKLFINYYFNMNAVTIHNLACVPFICETANGWNT